MQIVSFPKSEYPNGKLKNAQRYIVNVAEGILGNVTLTGTLTEKDADNWQAPQATVCCAYQPTAECALAAFRQAATEIGGYTLNENYIAGLFEEE